jgi:hypothetical protein
MVSVAIYTIVVCLRLFSRFKLMDKLPKPPIKCLPCLALGNFNRFTNPSRLFGMAL